MLPLTLLQKLRYWRCVVIIATTIDWCLWIWFLIDIFERVCVKHPRYFLALTTNHKYSTKVWTSSDLSHSKSDHRQTWFRKMVKSNFLPVLMLVVLMGVLCGVEIGASPSACATRKNYTTSGYCTTYPSTGLCGPAYAGRSVWLANDTTVTGMDKQAAETLALLQKNADQVSPNCLAATQRWTCYNSFPNCITVGGVAIPQLGCESDCLTYWDDCRSGFELYLTVAM